MPWWQQSQKSMSKIGGGGGGPAAPAGGAGAAAGDVAVQKVFHNLAPTKHSFHHGGHGALGRMHTIKEDINKKADRFIQMTKARWFSQGKSFRQSPAAGPPAPATTTGRDGRHLV
uniref:Uncharacterized protein n=1 Tax=Oryza brachyantha TaxID=4533 RepID=J3M3V5_ORYBR